MACGVGGRVLSHLCVRLEGFTYSWELLGKHAQRCAGLSAEKQLVRVACHVDYLLGFKGLARWRGTRKSHDGGAENGYAIVICSMHSHCDWDQVSVT